MVKCNRGMSLIFILKSLTRSFLIFYLSHSITISSIDGLNGVRLAKRDCTHSFYEPPPSSDIEKIRRNMVKQQKARALIVEILGRKKQLFPFSQWLCKRTVLHRPVFPLQFFWGSCGCCSWWHMVSEMKMDSTSHSTSGRASAMAFQTVWTTMMCSPGLILYFLVTCLENIQVVPLSWFVKNISVHNNRL